MALSKKPSKKSVPLSPLIRTPPGRDFPIETVRSLTSQTEELVEQYADLLEVLTSDRTCPQRVLRTAFEGDRLEGEAAKFRSLFDKFALGHRLGEGGFEHLAEDQSPLYVISFPTTGGAIAPKWKDEAFRLAAELAEARGEAFDSEGYEAEVRARTAPGKTSTKVQITEVS